MRNGIMLVLATVVCGCTSTAPDYSDVPRNLPEEAKPVWVMFAAAQAGDLTRLKSVCSPTKRQEIEAVDQSLQEKMLSELTALIPKEGLNALAFTVSRESTEVNRTLGLAETGKRYVARDGFAMVLVGGGKTFLPVSRRDGIWFIEGNLMNQPKNWIEQPGDGYSPPATRSSKPTP